MFVFTSFPVLLYVCTFVSSFFTTLSLCPSVSLHPAHHLSIILSLPMLFYFALSPSVLGQWWASRSLLSSCWPSSSLCVFSATCSSPPNPVSWTTACPSAHQVSQTRPQTRITKTKIKQNHITLKTFPRQKHFQKENILGTH